METFLVTPLGQMIKQLEQLLFNMVSLTAEQTRKR